MKLAKDIYEELRQPFPEKLVHWRIGSRTKDKSKGLLLAYLNARDVMKRLDDVVGMENWQDRYPYAGCCELSIRINGEWITKSDSAGETQVEGVKGQSSDAFKRAAVKFGIGRPYYYLADDADFQRRAWVPLKNNGYSFDKADIPKLPTWCLPRGGKPVDVDNFKYIVETGRHIEFYEFWKDLDRQTKINLYNSWPDKRNNPDKDAMGKTEAKKIIQEMETNAPQLVSSYVFEIEHAMASNDLDGAKEQFAEMNADECRIIFNELGDATKLKLIEEGVNYE